MTRVLFVLMIVGLALRCVAAPAAAPARTAKEVDSLAGPQLFIDDYLIDHASGVMKVTQHPKRHLDSPVLTWKEHTTQPYVTVLRDADSGKFRMWYNRDAGKDCAIAYAESDDGEKWTLPKLDILGPDNRLFLIGRSAEHGSYGVSVIDDRPREKDPAKRFKMMWWSGTSEPPGVAVAWSPDGLHWTPYEKNPVLPLYLGGEKAPVGVGDIVDLFYDPIRGRYASLLKLQGMEFDGWPAGPRAGKSYRRLVGSSVSDDFLNWRTPWRVMTPETRDAGRLEFYSAGGAIARGPLLISFVRMLHDDYSPEPGGEANGIGYATLATSRDGEHWRREDDIFLDRNPTPHTWDRAMTWVGCALPVGEEIYLYYGGYARGHKVEPTKERQIGLVKMKLDRFVARRADGDKPGLIVTRPFRLSSSSGAFTLNADATGGRIRVQLRDASGQIAQGFAFDDCEAVTGDGVALPVRWKSAGGVAADVKQPLQLEFELSHAALFAFTPVAP